MLIFISLLFTIKEFFLILIPCICKAVDRISNHWSIKTYHLTNLPLTFISLFKKRFASLKWQICKKYSVTITALPQIAYELNFLISFQVLKTPFLLLTRLTFWDSHLLLPRSLWHLTTASAISTVGTHGWYKLLSMPSCTEIH